MVSFKAKKRSDTVSLLLLRPHRRGGGGGLFPKRTNGTLLRSDDDDEGDDNEKMSRRNPYRARNLFLGTTTTTSASTPPGKKDPPASDVTPPVSPESDMEDDELDDSRRLNESSFSSESPYLQFEVPADPPGHKRTVIGGGDTSTSIVQNLLCMMDKACVAPTEGDWGSNASAGPASSEGDDDEADDLRATSHKESKADGVEATTTMEVLAHNSKVQHYLEPQKGEKHESFEMILREMTPPRKKKLGIKSLLHLPALPIRASAAENSNAAAAKADPTKSKPRARSTSPKATHRGPSHTRKEERERERRRHHRDNEGRPHKPLTAVSDLIPIEEEKKEDERFYLQPPRSKPRASVPVNVAKAINPPPITRNLAKEARYKQVLGTWMSSRTPLETITEDDHHRAAAAADVGSGAVRVPGIRNPDMFLSHSDMIGDIVQGRTPDSSPAKAKDHASNPKNTTKAREMEDIPMEPSAPIKKSRTWMGKFLGGLGLNEDDEDDDADNVGASTTPTLVRQRSAPGNLTPQSSALGAVKASEPQRLWKAAVCHETGRTYYYHRVTRRTTWTKPPEDELMVPSAAAPTPLARQEEDEIKQVLFPTFSKDTDEVLVMKEEIACILHEMGQDTKSVDKILAQYDGREKEFLERLRAASEDLPFDELIGRSGHDGASFLASATVGHSTFAGSSAMSRSLQNRSRQSSHVSGFSSALMSASTQPIRNTGIGRIFATAANPDIQSHATSISSKQGYLLPPTKADPLLHEEKLSRVPSNIPVPRSRELFVEEFNYNREAKRNKGVIRQTPERHVPVEPSTDYYGDNDDTDTKETDTASRNDSISALSEADLSFTNNLEAKRHALDEAIANEDWDLAGLLSDSLRLTTSQPQPKKREWTQTELDRYISSNDWDAVASYIARVRSGSKGSSGGNPGKSKPQSFGAQKRFGAKSQLQHKNLTARGESWSASESSFGSDFSSSSSDTYEEIMKARKQSDKFAC